MSIALGVATSLAAGIVTAAPIDNAPLKGLAWRNVGPHRGGRVVAVAGVTSQPHAYYFGGTGGGVWKTTDGGIRWLNVSDGQLGTGSVGAVAVAESDPNVVYAGMGEACIRGNLSEGDGVYRSTDAGKTWKNVGLKDTRIIGQVRVHPANPDLVYVAAFGHAFGPNAERGIFRSKDGGAHWEKVLFVDDKTGAVDLAMDPTNPRVLYAAFWQAVRRPWSMESGGPGSALYKTTDGGDTWSKLADENLPKKSVWGRIGVTVSPANPNRVWAIIEAEDGGVFRSDDAGRTWRKTNDERRLRQRAWYYTHIYADPRNAESVYALNTGFYRSLDGGKTFTAIPVPHGDNHDLWIAPDDPRRMIESNDGGANVSFDAGVTWSSINNQPTAQFYHVVTDTRFPYYLYGAQQDNTTVAIASRTSEGGIDRVDWYPVEGCESGYVAVDPSDPMVTYAGCYDGVIDRYDRRTGQSRNVNVYPDNPMGWGAEGMKYRFQWTFPIVASPHDPKTVYAGGNILFKTTNGGQSWTAISPDLTRNDPAKLGPSGGPITKDNTSVEYYCTIFAMAESPREKGLLWVGSDDGLVHVSRDGGAHWTNVTPKDLPEWSMVSQIDPSPHDAGTMYLAANRYKLDDNRPFIYVTRDYGQTWSKIVAGIPDGAFVRVVREDPVRKGLLYAGTERGVFVSLDDGGRWQPLQMAVPGTVTAAASPAPPPAPSPSPSPSASPSPADEKLAGKLPVVPVTDLVVKDNDLVVSTQGRSFWILDDVSPLRQMSGNVAGDDVHLFKPAPAYRFFGGTRPSPLVGQNPPSGALVYYTLKAAPKANEEVTLEVLDSSGKVLKKLSSKEDKDKVEAAGGGDEEGFGPPPAPRTIPARAGLNRFPWDLRVEDASRFKGMILWGGLTRGPVLPPGTYQVRLTAAGKALSQPLEVRKDPRLATGDDDYRKQYDLLLKIRDKVTETHDAITRIRETRDQVKGVAERARGHKAIADAADALDKKLTGVEEALYQTRNQSSQDPLNFPIRLNNKLAALAGVVSGDAAPTDQSYVVYEDLTAKIDAELARLRQVIDTDVPAFNALVREQNVPAVVIKPAAKG
ncbi:MAG: glycosyl hydrolase [Acidobacteria bacterium]|nr:MAG: glycosyl hydrolase [Acidobacteriota bacterium]